MSETKAEKCNAGYDNVNLSGGVAICNKPPGHSGSHEDRWKDRDGKSRVYLTWDDDTPGTHLAPGELAHQR